MSGIFASFEKFSTGIKLYHFTASSFAAHKASDALHTTMQDLADKFLESYQGTFGRLTVSDDIKFTLNPIGDENIEKFCQMFLGFLNGELTKICKENTGLLAIRDEMVNAIQKFLYLLTFE